MADFDENNPEPDVGLKSLAPFPCVCGCDHGAHGYPGCKHDGCFGCDCPRFQAAKRERVLS